MFQNTQPNATSASGFTGFGQTPSNAFNLSSTFSFGAQSTPQNAATNNNTNLGSTFGGGGIGGFSTFGNQPATTQAFGSTFGQKAATPSFNFGGTPNQSTSTSLFPTGAASSAPANVGLFGNTLTQSSTTNTAGNQPFSFGKAGQSLDFGSAKNTNVPTVAPNTFGFGTNNTGIGFQANAVPSSSGVTSTLGGFFSQPTTTAGTGGTTSGFLFGGPAATQANASNFQMGGLAKPTGGSVAPSVPFGSNMGAATTQSTGFSFGLNLAAAPASAATSQVMGGGFSLANGGALNLSTTSSSGVGGFNMGGFMTQTTAGVASTTNTQPMGSAAVASSTPMLSGLLSQTPSSVSGGFLNKLMTTSSAPTTNASGLGTIGSGFSGTSLTSSSLGLGGTPFGSSLGGLSSATSSIPLTAVSTVTTMASALPSKGFGAVFPSLSVAVSVAVPLTTTTAAALVATTTATTASSAAAQTATTSIPSNITYGQLEEMINRWGQELQEQERMFLEQATQVNAWDRVLLENGDKISQLNLQVERAEVDLERLNQDLDFILAQQNELEELLTPLEAVFLQQQMQPSQQMAQGKAYVQRADIEREHIYKLSENVDAELKRISSDLKEIIDRINSSASTHDPNDVMYQVTKILNAHMDSLQWIDRNTDELYRKVNDLSLQVDAQKRMN